jgi:hypothetical protein
MGGECQKSLDSTTFVALPAAAHMTSWAGSAGCLLFLQWAVHVPVISNFLGSVLQLGFHSPSWALPSQGLPPGIPTLPHTDWPPSLPLKSGWNLCSPTTLAFCMPAKPTSQEQCQCLPPARAVAGPTMSALASKCLDSWMWRNTFLGVPVQVGHPEALFPKQNLSNKFIPLLTWVYDRWGPVNSRNALKAFFLLS